MVNELVNPIILNYRTMMKTTAKLTCIFVFVEKKITTTTSISIRMSLYIFFFFNGCLHFNVLTEKLLPFAVSPSLSAFSVIQTV